MNVVIIILVIILVILLCNRSEGFRGHKRGIYGNITEPLLIGPGYEGEPPCSGCDKSAGACSSCSSCFFGGGSIYDSCEYGDCCAYKNYKDNLSWYSKKGVRPFGYYDWQKGRYVYFLLPRSLYTAGGEFSVPYLYDKYPSFKAYSYGPIDPEPNKYNCPGCVELE